MKTVLFVQYNPESTEEATAVILLMEQFPESDDPFWSGNPTVFDCRYVNPKIVNHLVKTVRQLADLYNINWDCPVILNVGAYFELADKQ